MEQKTVVYSGTTIAYRTTGKGLPVLLLHGFGEDSRVLEQQENVLRSSYQLIIPDIPGSGQSALLHKESLTINDLAECIKCIIDRENVSKLALIGHSMGGYISLAFAEKYPSALTALGLFHSSAYADDAAKIETRQKGIAFIKNNGALAFLKTSIPGLFADTIKSGPIIDDLLQKAADFTPEALIQYYEAMIARPDRTAVLKTLPCPVLFIAGAFDKAVPFEHSLEQFSLPLYADVNILRDSAHMGMLEEKDRSNAILAAFLQKL